MEPPRKRSMKAKATKARKNFNRDAQSTGTSSSSSRKISCQTCHRHFSPFGSKHECCHAHSACHLMDGTYSAENCNHCMAMYNVAFGNYTFSRRFTAINSLFQWVNRFAKNSKSSSEPGKKFYADEEEFSAIKQKYEELSGKRPYDKEKDLKQMNGSSEWDDVINGFIRSFNSDATIITISEADTKSFSKNGSYSVVNLSNSLHHSVEADDLANSNSVKEISVSKPSTPPSQGSQRANTSKHLQQSLNLSQHISAISTSVEADDLANSNSVKEIPVSKPCTPPSQGSQRANTSNHLQRSLTLMSQHISAISTSINQLKECVSSLADINPLSQAQVSSLSTVAQLITSSLSSTHSIFSSPASNIDASHFQNDGHYSGPVRSLSSSSSSSCSSEVNNSSLHRPVLSDDIPELSMDPSHLQIMLHDKTWIQLLPSLYNPHSKTISVGSTVHSPETFRIKTVCEILFVKWIHDSTASLDTKPPPPPLLTESEAYEDLDNILSSIPSVSKTWCDHAPGYLAFRMNMQELPFTHQLLLGAKEDYETFIDKVSPYLPVATVHLEDRGEEVFSEYFDQVFSNTPFAKHSGAEQLGTPSLGQLDEAVIDSEFERRQMLEQQLTALSLLEQIASACSNPQSSLYNDVIGAGLKGLVKTLLSPTALILRDFLSARKACRNLALDGTDASLVPVQNLRNGNPFSAGIFDAKSVESVIVGAKSKRRTVENVLGLKPNSPSTSLQKPAAPVSKRKHQTVSNFPRWKRNRNISPSASFPKPAAATVKREFQPASKFPVLKLVRINEDVKYKSIIESSISSTDSDKLERLDFLLYNWYLTRRSDGLSTRGRLLAQKAEELYAEMGLTDESNFSPSWILHFKTRYGIAIQGGMRQERKQSRSPVKHSRRETLGLKKPTHPGYERANKQNRKTWTKHVPGTDLMTDPVERGIADYLKFIYRRNCSRKLTNYDAPVEQFLWHYTLRDTTFDLAHAWSSVKPTMIQRDWERLLPAVADSEVVPSEDFEGFSTTETSNNMQHNVAQSDG